MSELLDYIKSFFKKPERKSYFISKDVDGKKLKIYQNRIVSCRAPTKKDWKFNPGTQWIFKDKKYIIYHEWKLVKKKTTDILKKDNKQKK